MLNTRYASLIEGVIAKAESPKVPLISVLFALIEGGIAKAESPKVPLIAVLFALIEGVIAKAESPKVPLISPFLIEGGIAKAESTQSPANSVLFTMIEGAITKAASKVPVISFLFTIRRHSQSRITTSAVNFCPCNEKRRHGQKSPKLPLSSVLFT